MRTFHSNENCQLAPIQSQITLSIKQSQSVVDTPPDFAWPNKQRTTVHFNVQIIQNLMRITYKQNILTLATRITALIPYAG